MRYARRFVVVVALTLTACTETKRPETTVPSGSVGEGGADSQTGVVRYLALGDSFTIGAPTEGTTSFPARLADRWRQKGCTVELENVAVSGFTTQDVITNELPRIATFKPTFVTLAIGANDIVHGLSEPGFGLEVYRQNVRKILDAARGSGARVVVIGQPEWTRSPTGMSYAPTSQLEPQRAAFDAALAEEARAKGAEWVDLSALYKQQADQKQISPDGLHPTAPAYDAWAAELFRVLASPCGK